MNGTAILQSLSSVKLANVQGKVPATLSAKEGSGFADLFQSLIDGDLSQISAEQGTPLLLLLQQLQLILASDSFPPGWENEQQVSLQTTSGQQMTDLLSALRSLMQGKGEFLPDSEVESLFENWRNNRNLSEEDIVQLSEIPAYVSITQLEQVLDRLLATFDGKESGNLPGRTPTFTGKGIFMTQDKIHELSASDLQDLIKLLSNSDGKNVKATVSQVLPGVEAKFTATEQAIIKLMSLISRSEQGDIMLTDSSSEKAKIVLSGLLGLQDPSSSEHNTDEGRGGNKFSQDVQMFMFPSMHRGLSSTGFNPLMHSATMGVNSNSDDTIPAFVDAERFAEEMESVLLQKIKGMNGNDSSRATIRLYPEHLGQLDIKILLQNGRITAQFSSETGMGKELIEKNMNILRTALVQHGLHIDKIEVNQTQPASQSMWNNERGEQMLHQQHHQRNQQQYQHSSSAKSGYSPYDEEEMEFAELLETRRRIEVSGIDYTA